jgi:hypothetical protein
MKNNMQHILECLDRIYELLFLSITLPLLTFSLSLCCFLLLVTFLACTFGFDLYSLPNSGLAMLLARGLVHCLAGMELEQGVDCGEWIGTGHGTDQRLVAVFLASVVPDKTEEILRRKA